jgi:uroporphyrinogen decarboxylase
VIVNNVRKQVDKVLQGNMDPSILFGTDECIKNEVDLIINGFQGTKGNYIANLGHGMYPDHDPDKLEVFLKRIKDYDII